MNSRMNSPLSNPLVPPFPFPLLFRFPPNLAGMPMFPNGLPFPYSMFMENQRLRELPAGDTNREASVLSSASETSVSMNPKSMTIRCIHGADPSDQTSHVNVRPMNSDLLEECKNLPTCDYLALIVVNQDDSHFFAIVYAQADTLNPGDTLDIPQPWLDLCSSTSNECEANLSLERQVLKVINFGHDIVLFKPKSTKTQDKSKKIQVAPDDTNDEMNSANNSTPNSLYGRPFSFNLTEPVMNTDSPNLSGEPSSESGYQCERCGKTFTYSYYRDKHLKYTRCVDNGDRKFPCPLCTRSFEKRDRLRIHILHVHENHRPHVCTICNKAFSQSSSLNKHLRVHSGERPYACPFCSKCFTASSILRTHIRQHSGEKPFKCAFCGRSFASHAAHDSHVRRTHSVQETENLYKCTTCDKCFDHPSHLNFHNQCVHNV